MQLNKFGSSRSPLQIELEDERIVVAGSSIFAVPKKWSFREFLLSYGLGIIGRDVVNAEPNRSEPKHSLARILLKGRLQIVQGSSGATGKKLDWNLSRFLYLCWDLFTVSDNAGLQSELVNRLRRAQLYQGARYEAFVAASFVRAGFKIEFEPESDPTRRHCEFVAESTLTGRSFSVEAKSRHRTDHDGKTAGVTRLMKKALGKDADHERITFIDVNLPYDIAPVFEVPWHSEVTSMLSALERTQDPAKPWPRSIVVFTNGTSISDEAPNGGRGTTILTAINHSLFKQPDRAVVEETYPEVGRLFHAVQNLAEPPLDFPGDV